MVTVIVAPSVMPTAGPADLLAKARNGVADGADYASASLAAVSAAAAVVAVRGVPDRRVKRITNMWVLLAACAPEIGEWAAYFAGRPEAPERTEDVPLFVAEVSRFIGVVEELLNLK